MQILNTIIPIFCVIFLGWIARKRGFIPPEFLGPANRLVFYIAIPAMVFSATAKASFKTDFHPMVLGLTLFALILSFALSWGVGTVIHISHRRIGTFIQNGFHGNLGYIGLAVAYYYLGEDGFTTASILTVFIMILQNVLSVAVLQFYAADADSPLRRPRNVISKVIGNPVILSSGAGIVCSLAGVAIPEILTRTLGIVSGMSLPMALLLIGASLDFALMKSQFRQLFLTNLMKLVLLPSIAFILYTLCRVSPDLYVSGLILLAAPSATVSYVMAREMNGDADFAVAAISSSTLFSSITFSIWLHITQ